MPLVDDSVRDHCHSTGQYRGAAHKCNLDFKLPNLIPVVFHNLRGHDSHINVQALGDEEIMKLLGKSKITGIRNNFEYEFAKMIWE